MKREISDALLRLKCIHLRSHQHSRKWNQSPSSAPKNPARPRKSRYLSADIDEVFWSIKKHKQELAKETCNALLNFPNLEIVSFTRELAQKALEIIEESHLQPRDAIHAATAIATKADVIISTDPHFDKLKEIKRKQP